MSSRTVGERNGLGTDTQRIAVGDIKHAGVNRHVTREAVVTSKKIYPGRWITIKGSNVVFSGSKSLNSGWFLGRIPQFAGNIF